jgi:molybdate transport system ATP-binding protein
MAERGTLSARVATRVGALALDVDVKVSGTLVVIGPNGAGKTTLLKALLGVVPGCEQLEVGGEVLVDTARGVSRPPESRRLAYVPQGYGIFPHMTALQNIAFALRAAEVGLSRGEALQRAREVALKFGLEALMDRRELSGGEKQRVALARALAVSPRAMLLDEPLAALDIEGRDALRRQLREALEASGIPALLVTHDPTDATALADEVAVLEQGQVVQRGRWAELLERPATAFVRRFSRV